MFLPSLSVPRRAFSFDSLGFATEAIFLRKQEMKRKVLLLSSEMVLRPSNGIMQKHGLAIFFHQKVFLYETEFEMLSGDYSTLA